MRAIKVLFLLTIMGVVQAVSAESSPVPMLEHSANQIISTLKQNKAQLKHNHQVIHQAVERYLLPHVDVNGMARSVVGRVAWSKASVAERQEFTRVFTQLVIRTYANPLAEYKDETVKFLPAHGSFNAHFTRVSSIIVRSNGQNIPLSYSLVLKNDNWKIYDLSVEGVSLLQSFRSQFGQVLNSSSMQELIQQMHKNTKAA